MDEFIVDVILIDLELKGHSGLDVTIQLRAKHQFHEVPILLLSKNDDPETLMSALFAGADSFVGKSSTNSNIVTQIIAMARLGGMNKSVRRLKQLETTRKLIGKCKHEFGNALAIADGKAFKLERVHSKLNEDKDFASLKSALNRFRTALKELDTILKMEEQEYYEKMGQLKAS